MKKETLHILIYSFVNLLISIVFFVFGGHGIEWLRNQEKLAQLERFGFYDKNLTILVQLELDYWYFDLFVCLGFVILFTTIAMLSFCVFNEWGNDNGKRRLY